MCDVKAERRVWGPGRGKGWGGWSEEGGDVSQQRCHNDTQ